MDVEKNLAALGIVLPAAPAPAANYLPWIITGNQVWIAGQAPLRDGKSIATGRVGESVSMAEAQAAARQCGVNILAQVKAA